MEREVFSIDAVQEIKQIVIGIKELRCRRDIERELLFRDRSYDDRVDLLEGAKQSLKHELLDSIGDFILVEEHQDRGFIEAELYLPYVKDQVIEDLTNDLKRAEIIIRSRNWHIEKLEKEILWLKLPWWKKLAAFLKND